MAAGREDLGTLCTITYRNLGRPSIENTHQEILRFVAAGPKWMESNPDIPFDNGVMNGEAVAGASKLGLDTTTSVHRNQHIETISPVTSPETTPPYWVQSHQRSFSNISIESVTAGITLQDNTNGADSKNSACWAKSAYIEDYVLVNERRTGIGAFVVWNITVETLRVRRFSSYYGLQSKMLTQNRAPPSAYEKGTLNSMTSAIDYCKHFPTPKLRCPHCLRKA